MKRRRGGVMGRREDEQLTVEKYQGKRKGERRREGVPGDPNQRTELRLAIISNEAAVPG